MKQLYLLNLLIIISLFLTSCKKDDPAPLPVASFQTDKNNVFVNFSISFTNHSTNATSYHWNFGDGTVSTLENPTHSYSKGGTYAVLLTASGKGGTDTISQNITILPSISGSWLQRFSFNFDPATIFMGTMYIVQQVNNKLSGTFIFSDGSGSMKFLGNSAIDGYYVTIEWMIEGYVIRFTGLVNSAYHRMDGVFYRTDLPDPIGTWWAEKQPGKSSALDKGLAYISQKERLHILIENSGNGFRN